MERFGRSWDLLKACFAVLRDDKELMLFPVLSGFSALLVLATEALNTALEELVDHLSPDWSAFAKHAKDLGSFAVMCQVIGAGLFAGYVLLS